MIFTARQLQQLHKSNGQITLPADARLTPLANDWLRARNIAVTYGDQAQVVAGESVPKTVTTTATDYVWWSDGPCAVAKAAIAAHSREKRLVELPISAEARNLGKAIKEIAQRIKTNRAAGAVLLVKSGAAAGMYANRSRLLRAVVASSRQAVETGKRELAANVLIIEYPTQTIAQVRNHLAIFTKAGPTISEPTQRELEEMTGCE